MIYTISIFVYITMSAPFHALSNRVMSDLKGIPFERYDKTYSLLYTLTKPIKYFLYLLGHNELTYMVYALSALHSKK